LRNDAELLGPENYGQKLDEEWNCYEDNAEGDVRKEMQINAEILVERQSSKCKRPLRCWYRGLAGVILFCL
jgi:hypothetical protein